MSNSLVPRLSGGELYDLVHEVDQMSEDEARYLLRQILSVLCYLLLKLDCHHSVLLVRSFAVQAKYQSPVIISGLAILSAPPLRLDLQLSV